MELRHEQHKSRGTQLTWCCRVLRDIKISNCFVYDEFALQVEHAGQGTVDQLLKAIGTTAKKLFLQFNSLREGEIFPFASK